MDPFLPFNQGSWVSPAEGQPAVDVVECDGEVGGMGLNVCGDALPTDDAILAAKMVVIGC